MIIEANEDEFLNLNIKDMKNIIDHDMYDARNEVVNNANYNCSRTLMMGSERSPVDTREDIDKIHLEIAPDTPGMIR